MSNPDDNRNIKSLEDELVIKEEKLKNIKTGIDVVNEEVKNSNSIRSKIYNSCGTCVWNLRERASKLASEVFDLKQELQLLKGDSEITYYQPPTTTGISNKPIFLSATNVTRRSGGKMRYKKKKCKTRNKKRCSSIRSHK